MGLGVILMLAARARYWPGGSRNCAIAQRERKLRSAGAHPEVGIEHLFGLRIVTGNDFGSYKTGNDFGSRDVDKPARIKYNLAVVLALLRLPAWRNRQTPGT